MINEQRKMRTVRKEYGRDRTGRRRSGCMQRCGRAVHVAHAHHGQGVPTPRRPVAGRTPTRTGGSDTTAASSGSDTAGSRRVRTPSSRPPRRRRRTRPLSPIRETSTIDPIFVFDYPDNAAVGHRLRVVAAPEPRPHHRAGARHEGGVHLAHVAGDHATRGRRQLLGRRADDGLPTSPSASTARSRRAWSRRGVRRRRDRHQGHGDRSSPPSSRTCRCSAASCPPGRCRGGAQKTVEAQGANFGRTVDVHGNYELKSWKVGEGVTFVRNELRYWDKTLPMKLKSITIKGVSEACSRVRSTSRTPSSRRRSTSCAATRGPELRASAPSR